MLSLGGEKPDSSESVDEKPRTGDWVLRNSEPFEIIDDGELALKGEGPGGMVYSHDEVFETIHTRPRNDDAGEG